MLCLPFETLRLTRLQQSKITTAETKSLQGQHGADGEISDGTRQTINGILSRTDRQPYCAEWLRVKQRVEGEWSIYNACSGLQTDTKKVEDRYR